jgi:hypothetical protein
MIRSWFYSVIVFLWETPHRIGYWILLPLSRFCGMTVKNKLSINDLPMHINDETKRNYSPYRKRRCVEGAESKIRRTVSQEKGLHELHVDHQREKILRGRSASCPIPLQHIYYAHYLYIDKFKVEKGDDYHCLFI